MNFVIKIESMIVKTIICLKKFRVRFTYDNRDFNKKWIKNLICSKKFVGANRLQQIL